MNFFNFFQTKTKARRAKNQFRGAPKCFRSNPYNYCPFHKIQNLQNAFSRKMDCPHNTCDKKIFVGRFTNYRRLKVKNAKKGQKRRLFDFSGAPFFVFSPNYPGFRPHGPFPTTYIFFSFFARIVCEKGPPRPNALITENHTDTHTVGRPTSFMESFAHASQQFWPPSIQTDCTSEGLLCRALGGVLSPPYFIAFSGVFWENALFGPSLVYFTKLHQHVKLDYFLDKQILPDSST